MTKLYVGNPTPHQQTIFYRDDVDRSGAFIENARFRAPKQVVVPPGKQVQVGGEMELPQVMHIIDQIKPYGAVEAADMSKGRRELGRVPYIYNIDRMVPGKLLGGIVEHNKEVLVDLGEERRTRAAIAAAVTLDKQTNQSNNLFEVEYEQLDQENDSPRIEQGVQVVKDQSLGKKAQKGRRTFG